MFEYGIIDSSYILRRNQSILRSRRGYVSTGAMIQLYLQSILKVARTFKCKQVIGCLDCPPYKKVAGIPDYKADRHKVCQEDIDNFKKEMAVDLEGVDDPEIIQEYEDELAKIKLNLQAENSFNECRQFLLDHSETLGLRTLGFQGFEADDLGYAYSLLLKKKKLKSLLVTVDHDWLGFINPFVFYSTPTGENRKEKALDVINTAKYLECPRYYVGILGEIYEDSHNNVQKYEHRKEIDFLEFSERLLKKDETLPGYHERRNIFDHMDIKKYIPEIKTELIESLGPTKPNVPFLQGQMIKYNFSINVGSYINYFTKG